MISFILISPRTGLETREIPGTEDNELTEQLVTDLSFLSDLSLRLSKNLLLISSTRKKS